MNWTRPDIRRWAPIPRGEMAPPERKRFATGCPESAEKPRLTGCRSWIEYRTNIAAFIPLSQEISGVWR